MSTASLPQSVGALPNYAFDQGTSPIYTRNPLHNEQRLLLRARQRESAIPDSSFTKTSKTGSLTLELYGQQAGNALPVFGKGARVTGKVTVQKRDTVSSVDVKIDGHLRLQEIGGAGKSSDTIVAQQLNIWSKDDAARCPASLDFTIPLRESYEKDGQRFGLPPTYDVHLSGVPGFRADVLYSITVTVTKTKGSLFGNQTVVSTSFVYLPRTRPIHSIPAPPSPTMFLTSGGSVNPEWEVIESIMKGRSLNTTPIITKLYIPTGRTFCISNTIPFRLHISSSALSLATFLPCSPTSLPSSSKFHDSKKGVTRVYVIRQISVDVRQVQALGTKTDIFKVLAVGEGSFRRLGDGPDWAAWEGEITLDQSLLNVGSFKASGLWVKDCIILSIIPPSPHNSPLTELRGMTPVRLVTEPHASDADFDPADWSDRDVKGEEGQATPSSAE